MHANDPYSGTQPQVSYAGFWKRVAATLLDGIIVGIPLAIILVILFPGDDLTTTLQSTGVSFAIQLLYKSLMESSAKQGTLGKMIVGIQVTDLFGQRISFGRAVGRYFASMLSSLTLMIGYMLAGWTSRKQALHDMIAGTLVIDK